MSFSTMLDADFIYALHDRLTDRWHQPGGPDTPHHETFDDLPSLIEQQHLANFELWHEEDKARDPLASDHEIATVKHAIDRLNQRRNDLTEQIDLRLLHELEPVFTAHPEAEQHSETPGMMVDRLSILALKIFHTREEAERQTASEEHRQKNRDRLALLLEQRSDLAVALSRLNLEMAAGRRCFKLYRQMKMYNDPELNPAIYKHRASQSM